MLRDCIKNERLWLANQTPTSRPKNQLCFTLENHLEMVVKNNRRQELWNGVADYSVWYDDESMGTSLIVVEAKSRQTFCEGLRQCLGYLGELLHPLAL